jgi:hypothetical protein
MLHQILEHLNALGILGVADDAFFAVVYTDKIAALAIDKRAVAAAVIAGSGLFYFDDFGTHIAEHHGAVGACQRIGKIQYTDAFQRFFGHK